MKSLFVFGLFLAPLCAVAQEPSLISGEELVCEFQRPDGSLFEGAKEYVVTFGGDGTGIVETRALLEAGSHLISVTHDYGWGLLVSMTPSARARPHLEGLALNLIQRIDAVPGNTVDCNQTDAGPTPSVIAHN